MLEIFRIPTSKDEDTKGIVCKLASLAKMQGFSRDQIDRTSSKSAAQIIVIFHKKSDRNNFFEQKYTMKTHSDQTNSVMMQRKNNAWSVMMLNLHRKYTSMKA